MTPAALKKQIKAYGLELTGKGRRLTVSGPNAEGVLVNYFTGTPDHLMLFWSEFRKVVDPQLSKQARKK